MKSKRGLWLLLGLGFLALGGCRGGSPGKIDAAPNAVGPTQVDSTIDLDGEALPAWPSGKYISVEEVHARIQAHDTGMLLINVVDETYYTLGHIEGSLKIPWDTIESRTGEIDRGRYVVVYCRRGVRSESAFTLLEKQAYPRVWIMEGGIERWLAAGFPTVTD
jgi:rhodanese-related sulfurtransferase